MARHTYLADLFRAGGLTVVEGRNWKQLGSERFTPRIIVEHSTVTGPRLSPEGLMRLLQEGRPDLEGPLSQWGTERDGSVLLAAAGRANHNGYGYGGNDAFGNEMANDGYGEQHTDAQLWSSHVQAALLCRYHNWPSTVVYGHKETDPQRKIDPRNIWMPSFRLAVQDLILHPPDGDEMSAEDSRKLGVLYDVFAGEQPNDPGSSTSRRDKVLDNAMWTKERVEKAINEAHAASLLAGNCNTMLVAIMEHLGIELPEAPPGG